MGRSAGFCKDPALVRPLGGSSEDQRELNPEIEILFYTCRYLVACLCPASRQTGHFLGSCGQNTLGRHRPLRNQAQFIVQHREVGTPAETLSNCHLAIASDPRGRMQDRYHPSLGVSLFDRDDGVVRPLYTLPTSLSSSTVPRGDATQAKGQQKTTDINACLQVNQGKCTMRSWTAVETWGGGE